MQPHYKLRDWIPFDKLDFNYLSKNSNAIHILEKNLDKVHWDNLSRNPSIFTYHYNKMFEQMKNSTIAEEIAQHVFSWPRLQKIYETYNIEMEDLQEIY